MRSNVYNSISMVDIITSFLFEHAPFAHYYFFGLLMLAGINVPISEDLLMILGGVISATMVPQNTMKIFIALFLGAYISDWVAYGIGRVIGPKVFRSKWFGKLAKKDRPARIGAFYKKYGAIVLLIGRFIPFGVRNALFITAGMGKMPFLRFLIFDGIACILSNSTLFFLAYQFGKNYQIILEKLKAFNLILFAIFLIAVIGTIWYKKAKKAT